MECPNQSYLLTPSRRLLGALCALHLLALAALAGTALGPAARLLAGALVAWSLLGQLRAHVALRRAGATALAYREGQWWLGCADGERVVRPCADSTVLPWLIVLRLRDGDRVRTLLVLADSLGSAQFRRLRVLLRLRAAAATQPGASIVSSASEARPG
jgi:hypothetical protein